MKLTSLASCCCRSCVRTENKEVVAAEEARLQRQEAAAEQGRMHVVGGCGAAGCRANGAAVLTGAAC